MFDHDLSNIFEADVLVSRLVTESAEHKLAIDSVITGAVSQSSGATA